ncbi:ThiF family adenylyltransferase [Solirubrobacter taibaiensis]|nr:ThiF family adenylyltransferase [Solirubrobacter taibaiensis]
MPALKSSVLIVGLGSGGFPVFQQLAQSGVSNFILIDPDRLDELNLLKHPGWRRDIGRLKVEIASEWLFDRNPSARVETLAEDLFNLAPKRVSAIMHRVQIVVSATDSNAARHYINELCIASRTPMTVGSVFRGGIGGSVLIYRPGISGCYACMESLAERMDASLPNDAELALTGDEEQMVYGRRLTNYAASGLISDIALVSGLHAQATLGEILAHEVAEGSLGRFNGTWAAMRIRAGQDWAWNLSLFDLPQLDDCLACQ